MARLAVNATRMELLRLRKRVALARRGHKLLKDKQDELMRRFLELLARTQELRRQVEDGLARAHWSFSYASATMSPEIMDVAFLLSPAELTIETSTVPVLNLRTPRFELKSEGSTHGYGFAFTSGALDIALEQYQAILPAMVELAEREKGLEMLSEQIEKTRRRVNALEYVLIPNLVETIRYITLRLSEMERGDLTRIMKVKSMLEAARSARDS
ncbi:V-type ATP synthase subunit D [Candidatus Fermentibacteria bacterium]|nr:V-type ATP synthase subunit D [Candidatus Fermentibacteria bacterium]